MKAAERMQDKMLNVIIESPFAASDACTQDEHVIYARRCLADSFERGEAPFASHLLYPQVLDDSHGPSREYGIHAGLAWQWAADILAVYTDYGISDGMAQSIQSEPFAGYKPAIEYRQIGRNPVPVKS